ncbi:hypothetical protein FA95DRAFT_1604824 [Auriscalpium vulgare]|uniref:Uncharacterized protein n=1 Tax=Auriscalpium vulgare TaxID=40419 RepID=A0ACB8RXB7_9AGAM|nr:hypothetical protein FA95DRAFT_1604824 [Auriscalpium vulgare]
MVWTWEFKNLNALTSGSKTATSSSAVSPARERPRYKLHKFFLAKHCSAFASLFTGPQAAFDAGSEHRDGLPVMDLTDDAEELKCFLKALYIPEETHLHVRHLLSSAPANAQSRWDIFPPSYHGILRLASKYDARGLRNVLAPLFKAQWPSCLDDWDRLQGCDGDEFKALICDEQYLHPDPVGAIRLAVESDIPDVLPLAFYTVACALSFGQRDNAKLVSGLSPDETRRLLLGKAEYRHYVDTEALTDGCADVCTRTFQYTGRNGRSSQRSPCLVIIKACYQPTLAVADHIANPIGWGRWAASRLKELPQVCKECREDVTRRIEGDRNYFWHALGPMVFGVEGLPSTWGYLTQL